MPESLPATNRGSRPVPARRGLLSVVIDPDSQWRQQIRGVLEKQGMIVCEAASHSEARQSIGALGSPDLLVCDIETYRKTVVGLNTGDPANAYAYRLAVIPHRREALHALAEGADDFLVWPNLPEAIEGRLQAVVQQTTLRAWLDTLRRAGIVVAGARKLDGLFAAVAARLRHILPVDHFIVARPETEDIRFEVVDMVSPADTPWSYCLRSPEAEVCAERFTTTPAGYRVCDKVRDLDPRLSQGMRSCLCLPLLDDGRVIGSLSMASREPLAFNSGLTPHLGALAVQVGHAMANIERYERAMNEADRLTTIVREVHHRIKNNIQGVVGLLSEHRDKTPQLATILNSAISQLHTIAEVHNLLSHRACEQVNLHELIHAIVQHAAALCRQHIDIHLSQDTQALLLETNETVPFALVFNELIQNAVKHGGPGKPPGTIRVSLLGGHSPHLSVANDGRTPSHEPASSSAGLGLQLVRALLPKLSEFDLFERDGKTVAMLTLHGWVKKF